MDIPSYILGKKAGGGSGGGTNIDGNLVNKLATVKVSKGDFVTSGSSTITKRLDNENDIALENTVTTNYLNNLFDNDNNTWAGFSANSSYQTRFYIRINLDNVNIPSNAKIKSIYANVKIEPTQTGNAYLSPFLFTKAGSSAEKFSSANNTPLTAINKIVTFSPQVITEGSYEMYDDIFDITTSNIKQYGIGIYTPQGKIIRLYYVSFTIEYEDEGKIKKVITNGQTITGVSNGDGNNGDTVEVYVPKTLSS